MSAFLPVEASHPLDVLGFAASRMAANEAVALGVVLETEGGGVRQPGDLLGFSSSQMAGYLSHGCVDSDLMFQAAETIREGTPRVVAYGANSPYADVRLPCRGSVSVLIDPGVTKTDVVKARDALASRHTIPVGANHGRICFLDEDSVDRPSFQLLPKLRIRVAGRGSEALALARLALTNRYEVVLQSPDDNLLGEVERMGGTGLALSQEGAALVPPDDQWTAFVSMFHDHDEESVLLADALSGPAFYVGALGSRRAHQERREKLTSLNLTRRQIDRISAPVGLIPRARDCHLLAISVLAEIAQALHDRSP